MQFVEVDDLRPDHLAAAEGKELCGERRSAGRRIADRLDAPEGLIDIELIPPLRRQVLGQEFRIALDREEDVVEVMGDPTGQPADRFQLLGLQELILGRLSGGDVDDGREDPQSLCQGRPG